ncbi:MAG TPA: F420-dependent NADP oxidoreductase [Bacteroidales bacterium]|nr:F420-dependent NADP oxidoreductase [Bacteroidales bacterium]
MGRRFNISFIGAGNVAEALALALYREKQNIISVTSAGGKSAKALAAKTESRVQEGYKFAGETDIIIIAVNDSSIQQVAELIDCSEETIIVHTAGSVHINTLGRSDRAGVLYPLQTFTKGRVVNMKAVPFFIEATDEATLDVLKELAQLIGSSVHQCVSERRKLLHLAAIFTCNFPNFMMTIGSDIVSRAGFNPGVLNPLIKEMAGKAVAMGPEEAQTGPARRNDTETIDDHLEILSYSAEYHDLYEQISKMIMHYYNK